MSGAPAAIAVLFLLLSGCAGPRSGTFQYGGELEAKERAELAKAPYDAVDGITQLYWTSETVARVGTGTAEPIAYRARLNGGTALGTLYIEEKLASWDREGRPIFHEARRRWLGGLAASHDRLDVYDAGPGAPPRLTEEWRFLLGLVAYREADDGYRSITIIFARIPLPFRKPTRAE